MDADQRFEITCYPSIDYSLTPSKRETLFHAANQAYWFGKKHIILANGERWVGFKRFKVMWRCYIDNDEERTMLIHQDD